MNCIQLFYLLCFCVYNSYHTSFWVWHTYIIRFYQYSFFNLVQLILVNFVINVLACFIFHAYFSFSWSMVSSTAYWVEEFFLCCIPNLFLVAGSCLWSLVGLYLSYLVPDSPKTLRLSDECTEPCIRQVGFVLSFRWSTYLFLRLTAI